MSESPSPHAMQEGAPLFDEALLRAAARKLGVVLTPEQSTRLSDYAQMLLRWNQVYNLTALKAPQEVFSHHVLDSLSITAPLQRMLGLTTPESPSDPEAPVAMLDVGSGGGLPGVVLAHAHPHWHVDCVDTVAKKSAFIQQVAAQLQLPNLRAFHSRVEALRPGQAGVPKIGYRVITSRAFASLADFVTLSAHLLAPQGVWLAMKGKTPDEELTQLPSGVEVFHVEPLQVPHLEAQRCIVWMRQKGMA